MQQKEQQQPAADLEVTVSAPSLTSVSSPVLIGGKIAATTRMVIHHVPDAPTLQALGLVALRHGQLEYALRMVIKSLNGQDVLPALESTFRKPAWWLRDSIVSIASDRLGPGTHLLKLGDLIERAEGASTKRNKYLHSLYARELDGDPMLLGDDHKWEPVPTPEELTELAREIITIADELHEARLHGFLKEAIGTQAQR
jgi:hypothetical protein